MTTPVNKDHKKATVKVSSPRRWDGPSLYQECLEQGIFPKVEAGNFLGYISRRTGQKVATQLPIVSGVMYAAYQKAEAVAIEKVGAPKREEKPKAEPKPKMERIKLDLAKRIHVLAKENPRRSGSEGHKNFERYSAEPLVSEYLAKDKASRGHLLWDIKHGFIELK